LSSDQGTSINLLLLAALERMVSGNCAEEDTNLILDQLLCIEKQLKQEKPSSEKYVSLLDAGVIP
jgi:hypothetical protein